jgi:Protein of unknown function (DUF4256)
MKAKKISSEQQNELLIVLKNRFDANVMRHADIEWSEVQAKLENNPNALWSLFEMERTGGEPDVIAYDTKTNEYIFCDCAAESPSGRRSVCFDRDGLDSRKEHKPHHNAVDMAAEMGIELVTEKDYRYLQQLGIFDAKTSSWIQTPEEIRTLGGALFADYRYGTVFVYHNGAQSYYGVRGFRGKLRV